MPKDKAHAITQAVQAECIALRVRLLSRAVTAIYDDALRSFGLTINQFSLLVVVSRLAKTTAKRVAQTMLMDPSTVSRNLERMRKEGWLRGITGDDARTQELTLTAKGAHLVAKAHPAWLKAQSEARRVLGKKNTAMLKSVADGIWGKAGTA